MTPNTQTERVFLSRWPKVFSEEDEEDHQNQNNDNANNPAKDTKQVWRIGLGWLRGTHSHYVFKRIVLGLSAYWPRNAELLALTLTISQH